MGWPPAPRKPIFTDAPKDDPVVQVVDRAGLDDFGFLILRTDYSSEERWEKWQEGYRQIIEATWANVSGGEKVTDKFLTPQFDNEVLNDAGLAQIAERMEMFPRGSTLAMCLAGESDAVDSLLNPVPDQEPWVYAVDVSFDFEYLNDVAVLEYPGFFPVAISALAPELHPVLAGPQMSPRELWPSAKPYGNRLIDISLGVKVPSSIYKDSIRKLGHARQWPNEDPRDLDVYLDKLECQFPLRGESERALFFFSKLAPELQLFIHEHYFFELHDTRDRMVAVAAHCHALLRMRRREESRRFREGKHSKPKRP